MIHNISDPMCEISNLIIEPNGEKIKSISNIFLNPIFACLLEKYMFQKFYKLMFYI